MALFNFDEFFLKGCMALYKPNLSLNKYILMKFHSTTSTQSFNGEFENGVNVVMLGNFSKVPMLITPNCKIYNVQQNSKFN